MKKTSKNTTDKKKNSANKKKQNKEPKPYPIDEPELWILREEAPVYTLSPVQKIDRIKSGISKKELTSMKNIAALDYDALANLLSVGRVTLLNKKGDDTFNNIISEKILALADLYSYGYDVFEDTEKFNKWMKSPNAALGNKSPLEMADTIIGIQEIKNIIGRIDYGIYS